jgi:hypothetical protein
LSAQRAGRSPTDKQKMPDGVSSRTDKEIRQTLSVAEWPLLARSGHSHASSMQRRAN